MSDVLERPPISQKAPPPPPPDKIGGGSSGFGCLVVLLVAALICVWFISWVVWKSAIQRTQSAPFAIDKVSYVPGGFSCAPKTVITDTCGRTHVVRGHVDTPGCQVIAIERNGFNEFVRFLITEEVTEP